MREGIISFPSRLISLRGGGYQDVLSRFGSAGFPDHGLGLFEVLEGSDLLLGLLRKRGLGEEVFKDFPWPDGGFRSLFIGQVFLEEWVAGEVLREVPGDM